MGEPRPYQPERHLDGPWEEEPGSHNYRHFRSGPVVVAFDEGFEPDGELFTDGPIRSVHVERMDDDHVWLAIYYGDENSRVAVDIYSGNGRRKGGYVETFWRDER